MNDDLMQDSISEDEYLNQEEGKPQSFVEKIMSLFVNNSPEAKKRRLLRDIQKILKKQKYKFLNTKTEEALPQLAQFYYQIYKTTAVPASLISSQEYSPALKYLFIDSGLSEKQKELISRLHKDNIEKRIRENPAEINKVKNELAVLLKSITDTQKTEVRALYRQYLVFLQFIKFDYYFLLRKFDSNFGEMDFKYKPSFIPINCEYIVDDIIETVSQIPLVLKYPDWDNVFSILSLFKSGQDIISRGEWKKVLTLINTIDKTLILNYIVKYVNKDPFYSIKSVEPDADIFDEYFVKLKTSTELVIQKIINETKNNQRDVLLKEIFGTTAVSRMKYYTESNNTVYKTKLLGGFIHIDFMNYLKAFMLDYVKKDVLRLVNYFVVKVEWKSNNFSKALSDSMDELVSLSEKIVDFDQSLASDEEVGMKLNTYMKRMTAEAKYKTDVKRILFDVNNKAVLLGQESYRNLVKVAQGLKDFLPDLEDNTRMSIIINPSVVKNEYGGNISEDIKQVYRKIYFFLRLIKLMIGK